MRFSPLRSALLGSALIAAFLLLRIRLLQPSRSALFNYDYDYLPTNTSWYVERRDFWAEWVALYDESKPNNRKVVLQSPSPLTVAKPGGRPRPKPEQHVVYSNLDVLGVHDSHEALVKALHKQVHVKDRHSSLFQGKGVVVVAGGELLGPAIVGIHALRQTGSTLPVEVFIGNYSQYEAYICETYLPTKLNARCVVLDDLLGSSKAKYNIGPSQYKVLALLFSSFNDVLLLDSDSIPLVNPEKDIFATKQYNAYGYITWPDFWIGTESPHFYSVAGMMQYPTDLPQASADAGQLVVDKSRHLRSLLLAVYYNLFGPGYFYELLDQGARGQAEQMTFEAAAVALREPFFRVGCSPMVLGRHDNKEFTSYMIIQMGEDEKPAFVRAHAPRLNAGRLVDEGVLQDKLTGSHTRLWGKPGATEQLFGRDIEKEVWKMLIQTGCELDTIMRDWRDRKDVCHRLKVHFAEVFRHGSIEEAV